MSDPNKCDEPECQEGPGPTLCDLDTSNNEWVEGNGSICMLDNMCLDQVVYVLQRNPKARADLIRVTSCLELHDLLDKVPLLSGQKEDDHLQSTFNSGDCLPQYTIFRGNLNNI
jgi:hypothetical protein